MSATRNTTAESAAPKTWQRCTPTTPDSTGPPTWAASVSGRANIAGHVTLRRADQTHADPAQIRRRLVRIPRRRVE